MEESKLTESQQQLLAKIIKEKPASIVERSKRLVRAGVTTEAELQRWSRLIHKHETNSGAIVRWRNQGLSLPAIEQSLELQFYLQKNLSISEGIPSKNVSIVALNGLLRKLGVAEHLADPEDYPVSALDRMTTLLSAAAQVFRKYPLQGLSYAINELFDGNIEHAYQLCDSDEEQFLNVVRRKKDVLSAHDSITGTTDPQLDPTLVEKLKDLRLDV